MPTPDTAMPVTNMMFPPRVYIDRVEMRTAISERVDGYHLDVLQEVLRGHGELRYKYSSIQDPDPNNFFGWSRIPESKSFGSATLI